MKAFVPILCLVMVLGCGDGTTDPGGSQASRQPTSPKEVIDAVDVALEGRDAAAWDSLLTRDFLFVFTPFDAGDDTLDIPSSWGLVDEMDAISHLFEAVDVEGILAQWTQGPTEPSSLPAVADRQISVRDIFIELGIKLQNGESLFLQCQGDFLIYLREMPWTHNGEPVWKISRWEDRTLRAGQASNVAATRETTWGQIKAMYK